MSSPIRWFAAVVALGSITVAARAEQPPLAIVPASAPIVVQLHGWERTLARFNATIKAAAPDYAPLISGEIENAIAGALTGRDLKGLVKDGPVFLVFTEVPSGDEEFPEAAAVIRVANYAQFRDGILKDEERKQLKTMDGYESTMIEGKPAFLLNRDGYAIIAPSEKSLKVFLNRKADALAGKLARVLETKLVDSDISLYVDMTAINKKYGKDIAAMKGMMEQAFQQAEGLGALEMASMGFVKDFYAQLFQLIADCDRFVAAVDFAPDGFSLKFHAQVGDKTKTNELLRKARSVTAADMSRLPAGAAVYGSGTVGQEWMRGVGILFGGGMIPGGGDDDKAVADAMREMQALKIDGWSSSVSFPAGGVMTVRYQEPVKAVAATLKTYRAIASDGRFGGLPVKGKPQIEPDVQKLAGFTLHRVSLTWDLDRMLEKMPEEVNRDQIKDMIQKFLGTGQQIWFGTDGKSYVQVTARNWAAARAQLESYAAGKGTVGGASGYVATLKHLPERAALVGLIDMGGYTQLMFDALSGVMKGIGELPPEARLKKVAGEPRYVGYAFDLAPGQVTLDLWVPADGVNQVLQMLGPLLGSLGG